MNDSLDLIPEVSILALEGRHNNNTKDTQTKTTWKKRERSSNTPQGTNISPQKWHFEDDFPFPQMGYVNSLEGNQFVKLLLNGNNLFGVYCFDAFAASL